MDRSKYIVELNDNEVSAVSGGSFSDHAFLIAIRAIPLIIDIGKNYLASYLAVAIYTKGGKSNFGIRVAILNTVYDAKATFYSVVYDMRSCICVLIGGTGLTLREYIKGFVAGMLPATNATAIDGG